MDSVAKICHVLQECLLLKVCCLVPFHGHPLARTHFKLFSCFLRIVSLYHCTMHFVSLYLYIGVNLFPALRDAALLSLLGPIAPLRCCDPFPYVHIMTR